MKALVQVLVLWNSLRLGAASYLRWPLHNDRWMEPSLTATELERPCNQFFTTVTIDEINAVLDVGMEFAYSELSIEEKSAVKDYYVSPLRFDVAVARVCGSCERLDTTGIATSDDWESFCGQDVYGYEATHSSLAVFPVDGNGELIAGSLSGMVQFQPTVIEQEKYAQSLYFPKNTTEYLERRHEMTLQDFFLAYSITGPLFIAASSGMIAMLPDPMGTGASVDYDISYMTKMPDQQVGVVAWFAVQEFIKNFTSGCTELHNSAIVGGYSAGGASAAFAAAAMNSMGVEIRQAFVQAAPVDLEIVMFGGLVVSRLEGESRLDNVMATMLALFAAAYSNEMPFLSNTGTDQIVLSDLYQDPDDRSLNVREWFFGDPPFTQEEIDEALPKEDTFLMINPDLIEAGDIYGLGTCYMNPPDTVNILCQTIQENSAVRVLETAQFPVQACHSPNDELPILLSDSWPRRPDVLSWYQPPHPLLEATGDHVTSYLRCQSAVPVYIVSSGINRVEPIPNTSSACPAPPALGDEAVEPTTPFGFLDILLWLLQMLGELLGL